ncbi:hypothetical protein [Persephonella sp.]|uniref:hypothetical protein n=1 Tax=Persephonella sp. TaxID=2060922 RepID=UPI0025D49269|nr:hypothetical protein [Persephonella sp.]
MRIFLTGLVLAISLTVVAIASEDEPFYEGENVVGYVKDTDGNRYIVVETPDGRAKLIKTKKDPEEVIKEDYGITKKDFEIREE